MVLWLAATLSTPAANADDQAVGRTTAKERVIEAVKKHVAKSPNDYIGLSRAVVAAGGDPVRFSFDKVGLQNKDHPIEQPVQAVEDKQVDITVTGEIASDGR